MQNPYEARPEVIDRLISNRQTLLRRETEDFLRSVLLDYKSRSAEFWHRDYSSVEAYLASVEPNRQRWCDTIGVFENETRDLDPVLDLWYKDDRITIWWLTLHLVGNLHGRALLAIPNDRSHPFPLVIAQHGVTCSPERVFGVDDPTGMYGGFGRTLAEEGYAVIAPMNISGRPFRGRFEKMCALLGKTLWGLEKYRTVRLLDYLETRPEIDMTRTAMYGLSLGGATTLFLAPLEQRIKVVIISGFFNQRVTKLAIDDPRYESFLSFSDANHWWIPGWLKEFSDSDLISLVCPRPVLIQHGRVDDIGWLPMLLEEYETACEHYRRLGFPDRIEIDLHDGGHEVRLEKGLPFLNKWLKG